MARRSKRYKFPKTSNLDTKIKREFEGLSPDVIRGTLLCCNYNSAKLAIEIGYHSQTIWEVINRRRKGSRVQVAIAKILQNTYVVEGSATTKPETLKEAYFRIWGERFTHWFINHV